MIDIRFMIHFFKYCFLFLLWATAITAKAQTDFLFSDASKPSYFVASIDLNDSLPKVKALVNGKEAIFVLDNGCSVLVINEKYWKKKMDTDTNIVAKGVGGAVLAGSVYIDSFNWHGITKNHFKAVAANLPYLGDSICGLMGYDVFKDYEVIFDYPNKRVSFMKQDSTQNRQWSEPSFTRIPMMMNKHLPVVNIRIGNDTLRMAIDCASTQNLMYSRFISHSKDIKGLSSTVLRGAGIVLLPVLQGVVAQAFVDMVEFEEMQFTFDDTAMEQVNQNLEYKIDGLLGYPFLKQYKILLNYNQQKIIIF